jgi:hypothetical protein
VIEIVGRDLPATSPARAVVKDVRLEIAQINRILTDLLETARPHPPQIRRSNLNTTVEHAVMLARQQVLSQPIKIELQKAPDLPRSRARQRSDSPGTSESAPERGPGHWKAGTVRVEIGSREGYAACRQRHGSRHSPKTWKTSSGPSTPPRATAPASAFL